MLKIRRPSGRLIFNMGIAIPGKTVFLIETAPWKAMLGKSWRVNRFELIVFMLMSCKVAFAVLCSLWSNILLHAFNLPCMIIYYACVTLQLVMSTHWSMRIVAPGMILSNNRLDMMAWACFISDLHITIFILIFVCSPRGWHLHTELRIICRCVSGIATDSPCDCLCFESWCGFIEGL